MIYRFRLITDENEQFFRIIEIDENDTFLSFHNAIQDAVEYDNSQLASFYSSDKDLIKGEQITLMDMSEEDSQEIFLMESTKINEFIKSEDDTLIYVFDFFSDRAFYIFLSETKEEDPDTDYPICTQSHGEAPVQLEFDNTDIQDFLGEEYFSDNETSKKSSSSDIDYEDELKDLGNINDLENFTSIEDLDDNTFLN